MDRETIVILDFGSQYSQLIARRIRENHVYALLLPPSASPDDIRAHQPAGIVLSGGPASLTDHNAPTCDPAILDLGVPVLGICYGMQLICRMLGGTVVRGRAREYGRAKLTIRDPDDLLANLPSETTVWMSHGDIVERLGQPFRVLAETPNCPLAAVRHPDRPLFGVQFHPEVAHTPLGGQILRNFLFDICRCRGTWQIPAITTQLEDHIRHRVGPEDRVICALSGGVDSAVAATLIHHAIGDRLVCIFVDTGLLRKNERRTVESTFRGYFRMTVRIVDAADRFLARLRGVSDPQRKRIIIGHEFIDVFRAEARRIPNARFLAQGTIYPDVIESGKNPAGTAATIKTHHNVGGLPEDLGFELLEPLRDLFKDEVRAIGETLGLPEDILWQHPFPGPGLAVRIVGEVTPQRLAILRDADEILLEEIRAAGLYRRIAQAFVVLLPVASVAVMGDERQYADQHVAVLRCVESRDFMTADWVHLDPDLLTTIANRIINEVEGINRVVYDVSSKPPATIEWE